MSIIMNQFLCGIYFYLKLTTLVFCNIFLSPSRIQVPLLKNTNVKKYVSTEANYLQNSQASTLSKKFIFTCHV